MCIDCLIKRKVREYISTFGNNPKLLIINSLDLKNILFVKDMDGKFFYRKLRVIPTHLIQEGKIELI